MGNIELIIKIPEELYKAYKGRPPMLGDVGMDMITQSIANGSPLPKEHGKLVDQEILFENLFQRNVFQNITLQELSQLIKEAAIIEADKEK